MAFSNYNGIIKRLLVTLFVINVSMLLVFRFYIDGRKQIIYRKTQIAGNTTDVTDLENQTQIGDTSTTTYRKILSSTNSTSDIIEDHTRNASLDSRCQNSELKGNIQVDYSEALEKFRYLSNISADDIEKQGELFLGLNDEGYKYSISKNIVLFEPKDNMTGRDNTCPPVQNVAFIIPFRRREKHLQLLLGHLVPILQRQNIRFSFFVVTQTGDEFFNKGRLMNTAFEFISEVGRARSQTFDCYIFHDVDLFVEHDTLLYRCTGGGSIDHFAPRIDKFKYVSFCCGMTVGGVIGFTEEQYRKVNGYSNKYWGWGAEDDDMADRLELHHLEIERPEGEIGKFTMMSHQRDNLNPINKGRFKILWDKNKRNWNDGIGSLDTTITAVIRYPLFINILVDVGKPPPA